MCAGLLVIFFLRKIMQLQRLLKQAIPVFAIKGQSLTEHWDYLDRSFMFPKAQTMILDDGGDATLYVLLGARVRR